MAIYSYIAIQQDGKEKKGIIDATSIAAARGIIRRQKLFVKSLKEDKEKRERVLFPYLASLLTAPLQLRHCVFL